MVLLLLFIFSFTLAEGGRPKSKPGILAASQVSNTAGKNKNSGNSFSIFFLS